LVEAGLCRRVEQGLGRERGEQESAAASTTRCCLALPLTLWVLFVKSVMLPMLVCVFLITLNQFSSTSPLNKLTIIEISIDLTIIAAHSAHHVVDRVSSLWVLQPTGVDEPQLEAIDVWVTHHDL
jgi:hypothetical protein